MSSHHVVPQVQILPPALMNQMPPFSGGIRFGQFPLIGLGRLGEKDCAEGLRESSGSCLKEKNGLEEENEDGLEGKKMENLGTVSIQCPMLTTTAKNYTVWCMRMEVVLKVNNVWETIDPGLDDRRKNIVAIALLFQSMPDSLILEIGEPETSKGLWEAIKERSLAAEEVRKSRAQRLIAEFERILMEDSHKVSDFVEILKSVSAGEKVISDIQESQSGSVTQERGRSRRKRWGESENDHSRVICWKCNKAGHFAKRCPDKVVGNEETNLVETQEADNASLCRTT